MRVRGKEGMGRGSQPKADLNPDCFLGARARSVAQRAERTQQAKRKNAPPCIRLALRFPRIHCIRKYSYQNSSHTIHDQHADHSAR